MVPLDHAEAPALVELGRATPIVLAGQSVLVLLALGVPLVTLAYRLWAGRSIGAEGACVASPV